jgi:prepilin-type N-terminal cleavage/methylation domain-containing protein
MFTRLTVPRSNAGFTLIEIIAAMAIMMTVIGGVYGVANGALSLGKTMSETRIHETRLMNFVSTWREYLETLPPNTRITVGEKPSRKFGRGSLLIENGTVPFAWTRDVKLCPAVEFKLVRSTQRKDASDLLVRHLRKPERANSLDEYEVLAELPLLEGLREFTWEFYEVEKKRWVTLWEDRSGPPLFMRLRFSFAHEPRETRYEYAFWISGGEASAVAPTQQGGGV